MGAVALISFAGCTSLSEGGAGNLPPNPELSRRVEFKGTDNPSPRRQIEEQASEINRKRNIEESGRIGPATTPPEMRPQQAPNAPVDTTKHQILRPLPTRPPVGNQY